MANTNDINCKASLHWVKVIPNAPPLAAITLTVSLISTGIINFYLYK